MVTRLDRLARSTWHLCQIAEVLARKRVHLSVLDQSIDTSDATGRLLGVTWAALPEEEPPPQGPFRAAVRTYDSPTEE